MREEAEVETAAPAGISERDLQRKKKAVLQMEAQIRVIVAPVLLLSPDDICLFIKTPCWFAIVDYVCATQGLSTNTTMCISMTR
ncbi:hypothetical protein GN958_ATG05595 [Phytophthora infestans]|uniref:Uncharacterized protein n=1 Tax=Phytophthora infestans TaxID=4787 RepID=A0A8S9UX24_PHYIN|nr:hypothetical protein GN958_ATG05595 [Phytophthora infestans]